MDTQSPPEKPALSRREWLAGATSLALGFAVGPGGRAAAQAAASAAEGARLAPPQPPRIPFAIEQLGRRRDDPYHWMKYVPASGTRSIATLPALLKDNLALEAAYAKQTLDPLQALRAQLLAAMMARDPETAGAPPLASGPWLYWSEVPPGGVHRLYLRAPAAKPGEAVTLVDEAQRARGLPYYRSTAHQHSPDHRYFAWAEDVQGNDRHRICLYDSTTGATTTVVADDAFGYGGLTFSPSSSQLFWIRRDAHSRPTQVYRTALPSGATTLVYEETDPAIFMEIRRTAADGFVSIRMYGPDVSEVRLVPAADEAAVPAVFAPRRTGIVYDVDEWRDEFVVLTNEGGAFDNEVRALPKSREGPGRIVAAHVPGDPILAMLPFDEALVLFERSGSLHRLKLVRGDGSARTVAFDEIAYAIELEPQQPHGAARCRIAYQSPKTPRRWIDVDLRSGATTVVRQEVAKDFDPDRYVVERLTAAAPDGETVPITLLRARGRPRDGSAPLLLYGYGAYGISSDPEFSVPATVLVDRGWNYAIAHVRGGSEKGQRWFQGGRRFSKRNSMTDFVACAEFLCAQGYASRGRVAAYGLSAGGLLVGGAMNIAPALWGGVIAQVPFVDMLNTMSDASHPLVPLFRPDWGDPLADPRAYDYIASISPYENVSRAPYPPLLCTAGLKDDRVSYWEPWKLVAAVRHSSTSRNPAVLLLDAESGHQGSGNRGAELRQAALFWAFAEAAVAGRLAAEA